MGDEVHGLFRAGIICSDFRPVSMGQDVQGANCGEDCQLFIVVAMVLQRKPDVLLIMLPTLRETSKYQGQDNLPVIVWMIVQASEGDLALALYATHNVMPLVCGKSSNPQSCDLVLQLVERILSMPKARTILVNGAVRKGEHLVPPSALEILIGVIFPAPSARVKIRGCISDPKGRGSCWLTRKQSDETSFTANIEFCC